MSTSNTRSNRAQGVGVNWVAGGIGGVVGALAMGVLIIVMNAAVLAVAIPSLYTLAPPPSLTMGMLVHMFHGAVLGLVFVGIVTELGLSSTERVVGAGLVWGAVTWVVLAGLVMPQWLSVVGSPVSPPFPNFALPSLLWHLVYGGVLVVVYLGLAGRIGA